MILKLLTVWLVEALAAALLLGGLFGALSAPDVTNFLSMLPGVWALAAGIAAVLFLHGYYLLAALAGVFFRSRKLWVYPPISATIFVIYTHIVFIRLKPDLSSSGRATEFPFLIVGACLVFACAMVGNLILSKWVRTGSSIQSVLPTDQRGLA